MDRVAAHPVALRAAHPVAGRPARSFAGAMRALLLAFAWLVVASPAGATLPIQHWTTSTGARVLFVRADAIPILDVNVDFDAGARRDPADKSGLASMTVGLLGMGTRSMDERRISEAYADLGALRTSSASDDRASVALRTLASARERDAAVALLEAQLSQPAFPATVLAREKARTVQSLREAETQPDYVAGKAFARAIYPEHPYGREATPKTVAAIGRDDVVRFHALNYTARRAVVSMIGAIDRQTAEAIAERLTARLPTGVDAPVLPEVVAASAGTDRRIAHPATQSHILIGQPAIARGDPDFFPLFVGNYVLGGGGFVSRLTTEVRERRGLAYSVYSYFAPAAQPGPFTIGLQTQKAQTATALGVVRDTLAAFLRDGPTEAELRAAKDNLVGGFALRIDSNRKILDNLSLIGFYGLPLDWLDRWTERVEAVTAGQVREAFARHLRPGAMSTVVVGDAAAN